MLTINQFISTAQKKENEKQKRKEKRVSIQSEHEKLVNLEKAIWGQAAGHEERGFSLKHIQQCPLLVPEHTTTDI